MEPSSLRNEPPEETKAGVTDRPVLVTGCGGWLASHCVYQLLDKGYYVRGTIRSLTDPKYDFLKTFHPKASTHLALVEANLLDESCWDGIVKECEFILHVASPFSFAFKHEDEVIRPALQGVTNVYEAAMRNCTTVKRIIHTSSVVAAVYGHPPERYHRFRSEQNLICSSIGQAELQGPHDEIEKGVQIKSTTTGMPLTASFDLFIEEEWSVVDKLQGYERSKTLAEAKAWEIVNAHNQQNHTEPLRQVELVTILPGFIFGPLLGKVHAQGESSTHVGRILNKTFPCVPPLFSSHVDVRDAAEIHILAMEASTAAVAGQRFFAAADDGNISFAEQARLLARNVRPWGFNPSTIIAPKFMIAIAKHFLSSVKVAADKIDNVTYVSNTKTKSRLGKVHFRSTEEALVAHALSLMKFGGLRPRKTPPHLIENCRAYE